MIQRIFSFVVLSLLLSTTASAQFQGYLDIKVTAQNMQSTARQYFSKGNVRSETSVNIPGMGVKKMVTIFKASNPDLIVTLDEQNKTYSEINLKEMPMMQMGSDDENDAPKDKVKIKKLGKKKVLGYNCDHVRIISEDRETDLWVTKDILGFDMFEAMNKQDKSQNQGMMKMIGSSGIKGFPLKMKDKTSGMVWQVTKIKKQRVPSSKFSVPKGYKKASIPGMGGMSPEQRKQMEDMMKRMKNKFPGN